ncbi:MAG: hypothetical protein ACTHMU_19665 [Thermomicrobiales bacterium]
MQGAIFMFATDLHDEGFDAVLDNVQQRAGLHGVSLACAYHHARDIFPHNPVRRVRFLEGGTVFFQPDPARYAGLRIAPQVSRLAQEVDILAELVARAERRGLAVRAWTVFLHNSTLGERHPDCAIHNAFGDPYITALCPAHPDVRAYARALAADLAGRGVTAILAEALGYAAFDHGYHHERSFIPLSPVVRFLLGLCFCEHCASAIGRQGVDVARLRQFTQTQLLAVLAGEPHILPDGPATWGTLAGLADGELGRFLIARQAIVTSLAQEVTTAVEQAGSARFVVMDMAGAAKGYATGQPAGDPAPASAWQDGLDLPALSRTCHGIEAIGYTQDPERLRLDLDAYGHTLAPGTPLAVALRPMLPDCDTTANLAAKVAEARQAGVGWLDFYHYGFIQLPVLDRIREAMQEGSKA